MSKLRIVATAAAVILPIVASLDPAVAASAHNSQTGANSSNPNGRTFGQIATGHRPMKRMHRHTIKR